MKWLHKIKEQLVLFHIKVIKMVALKRSLMINVNFDIESDCLFKKIKKGKV